MNTVKISRDGDLVRFDTGSVSTYMTLDQAVEHIRTVRAYIGAIRDDKNGRESVEGDEPGPGG